MNSFLVSHFFNYTLIASLTLATSFAASAAEPTIERTALFSTGDNGYNTYRIPAIVTTPQKTVLVAAEGRRDGRGDWGHIDLFYRRSTDSGRTWESARVLVSQNDLPAGIQANPATTKSQERPAGFTISNATWITDRASGRTLLLFCVEYMRCFVVESNDGGLSFSKPREITGAFEGFRTRDGYAWRVIATGPGHGEQLASGRLIVPVWISTADGRNAHHPSVCGTIYSDDGGRTWQAGEIAAGRDDGVVDPSETVVVEVAPGKVMLNIRNEARLNRRAFVWGADGATGWTKPEFHPTLWEPVCMASITRLPGGVLAFSNPATLDPIPSRPNAVGRQRQNLGVRISHDGGKSWSAPLVLEAGPSAYSDLTVAPDGTLLCFYEHGKNSPYEAMSVARIPAAHLPRTTP